jgi:hypothetical protein
LRPCGASWMTQNNIYVMNELVTTWLQVFRRFILILKARSPP